MICEMRKTIEILSKKLPKVRWSVKSPVKSNDNESNQDKREKYGK